MGLWDTVKDIAGSIGSGISGLFKAPTATTAGGLLAGVPGALIGGAVDLGANWLTNEFIGKPNAEDAFKNNLYSSALAFDKSYDAYKRRYRDTMADMKAAGLNPILAAASGGFNVSGQPTMAKAESPMATLPQTSSAQSYMAMENAKLANQQAKTEEIKRTKLGQESRESLQRTFNERARRGLIEANERESIARAAHMWKQVLLTEAEIKKAQAETGVSKKMALKLKNQIEILKQEYKMLVKTSQWYGGAYGDFLGYVTATLKAVGAVLGGMGAALVK